MDRQTHKATSNNPENPNQNYCSQRVCQALGVADSVRYLHTIEDVKRAAGTRFSVRSVKSAVKAKTAGGARKRMSVIGALAYIVWVPRHVLLMDLNGRTIIDTAPRARDSRQLLGVWGIYPKR